MRRVLSLLLLLVAFAGVSVPGNQHTDKGTPVPFNELDPNRPGPRRSLKVNSGILDPLRIVIRDRDAWLEMWKLLFSNSAKPVSPANVSDELSAALRFTSYLLRFKPCAPVAQLHRASAS